MFTRLTFADLLREERLREFNDCHNPSGAGGGQFCSKGGGGKLTITNRAPSISVGGRFAGKVAGAVAKHEKSRKAAFDAIGKLVPGFQPKRGEVAGSTSDPDNPYSAEYRAIGVPGFKPKGAAPGLEQGPKTRARVKGFDVGPEATPGPEGPAGAGSERLPGPKKVKHKVEYPAEGARRNPHHVATYRGMPINTLPSYTTPYYYVDAPGFGQFHHTHIFSRIKRQIDSYKDTGETAAGAKKRKGSERYQKRKARYGS